MKQHLSRTAVVLATSALTLGLTATGASAVGGTYAGPLDGPRVGPGSHGGEVAAVGDTAEQRKVDRLRKALAVARAERMDARASVISRASALSDRQSHANDAAVAHLAATEAEHLAKVDLSEARTRLNEVRTIIADGDTLLAQNQARQEDAAARVDKAQDDGDAAETKATDLRGMLPGLEDALDAAGRQVIDAEAEIAWLTGNSIPLATANATGANQQVESLRQQTADALALYTQRTWAYHECRPQPDGQVNCLDFSWNWGIRSEVTHPWGIYLDLQAQQVQAQAVASNMDAMLADVQRDLTYWNGEHTTRTSVRDAAQAEVGATTAAITHADEAFTAAQVAIVEQQGVLDTLVTEAADLTERLATSKADEKAAVVVATKRADALTAATAATVDADHERGMTAVVVTQAEDSLDQSKGVLADAQAKARHIKGQLHKARQQNR